MYLKLLCIFALHLINVMAARKQLIREGYQYGDDKIIEQCDNKSDSTCDVYIYDDPKKPSEENLNDLFNQFKKKYNIKYRSIPDSSRRFEIFKKNYQLIKGFNQFLDITQEEFEKTYLGYKPETKDCEEKEKSKDYDEKEKQQDPPGENEKSEEKDGQKSQNSEKKEKEKSEDSEKSKDKEKANRGHQKQTRLLQTYDPIDWTKNDDIVSPVQDQSICSSCWAFSAIGAVESALAIAGKSHPQLSEQQLMVCRELEQNQVPCYVGGLPSSAFQQIIENGITTNDTYPYSIDDNICRQQGGDYKISNYTAYYNELPDCDLLEAALANQPISVCIDSKTWKGIIEGFSGIFSECPNNIAIDHCVLLVAADQESWTIKNSWGTWFGNNGYLKLPKGNSCGICQEFSYPIV